MNKWPILAAIAIAAFALTAAFSGTARAAATVQVESLDCARHPGQLDVITLTNSGDTPQDLAGWSLRSDPEASQQMSLGRAGSMDPGEKVYVVAGYHAVELPEQDVFLWSNDEVLRDSGDPPDYVKIYDAAGSLVGGMDCNGQPLPGAATPPPATPEPVAPTPAPQVEQQTQQPSDASQQTDETQTAQTSQTTSTSATVRTSAQQANSAAVVAGAQSNAAAVPAAGGPPADEAAGYGGLLLALGVIGALGGAELLRRGLGRR